MKKKIHLLLDAMRRKMDNPEKHLAGIGSQLADLSLSMESLMSDVEPEFLNLCRKLEIIYSESQALSQMVMDAIEFADNGTGDMSLVNVGAYARGAVEKLKSFQDEISESLESLCSGRGHLEKLSGLCTQIDKIPLFLDVIALNIGIESNRSEKSIEMFAVFVEEVRQLSKKMGAISEDLYNDTESVRGQQVKSQGNLSKHLVHLAELSGSAEKIVDKATAEISCLIGTSLSSLKKAGACSRDISSQVSQIVMAIQFHDIVRQQIEHVVMALNDVEKLCRLPHGERGRDGSPEDTAGQACFILELQNEQIKRAVSEIEDAYRKISAAFESIEMQETELVGCMGTSIMNVEKTGMNTAESPFSAITAGLEHLDTLMSRAQRLNRQVEDAFSEASECTLGLSKHIEHVQQLSLDLHRKALNAIIKSAHLGDMGRTLEVFAKEVARTSDETNTFTEGVTTIITRVRNHRKQLEREPSHRHGECFRPDTISETTLHQGTQAISDSYQGFMENSMAVSKLSRKLESSISDAKADLFFMPEFSNGMMRLLRQSEALLHRLGRWKKEGHQTMGSGVFDASRRYTMESERVVHAGLIENSSYTGPGGHDQSSCGNDSDIVLSGEEGNCFEDVVTCENHDEEQCSIESGERDAHERVDKDSEFDDNIELF